MLEFLNHECSRLHDKEPLVICLEETGQIWITGLAGTWTCSIFGRIIFTVLHTPYTDKSELSRDLCGIILH